MSKRGAEEYITKEHGSTPNSSSGEAKVKMATAAQMAKRKMAVPKSRAGRTGHSPMPGAGSSNPFAGTSTFGASQQQAVSSPGAISFGTSQSFPTGDSGSNNSFNFSVPGQSSSFTFGQSAPNNPFANLNGGAGNQQQNNQESGDTMMESPQKKPAFGSSVFGSSSTETSSQTPELSFGQSPSQPTFSFGQPQPQTNGFGSNSTSSLFGQNSSTKPQEQKATTNTFGQSTQSQSNAATTGNIFGQNASATQQNTQPSAFNFGQPATSAPSAAPTFSFGQTSSQPSSNGALFGGLTQTSQPSFGAPTPASEPTSDKPSFGAAPTPSTNNMFGGFGSAKPLETAPTPGPQSQSLFGQPATSAGQEEFKPPPAAQVVAPKSNPFASLFGQKPAESVAIPGTDRPKPLFNLASSTQSGGLFGAPTADKESAPKPAGETPQKPLFSFGVSATTPKTDVPPSAKPATESSVNSNPFASLSANKAEPPQQDKGINAFGVMKDTPTKPASGFQALPAFGSTPSAKPSLSSATTAPGLFGTSEKSQAAAPTTAQKRHSVDDDSSTSPQAFLFGNATPQPQESSRAAPPNMFSTAPKAAPSVKAAPAKTTPIGEAPTRAVNTNPPTRIPPYLNGDDYKAYDSNYRLHSLNREFQKRIASLDPSQNDFENIIKNYVAARESIGESIGLYARHIAGMKRKADDADDRRGDDHAGSKKAKSDEVSGSQSTFSKNHTANPVFEAVPSSFSRSSAAFASTSPAKTSTPASSNASSLFNSMISKTNAHSESKPSNPFANLPKTSTDTAEASAKPAFFFGATPSKPTSVGSTTPTKSPPKKPAFEVPKFAIPATGGNFMDAFKKQSEASAKKFAKEAKEKRKAEEFDSEDDDEEEWNKKYEEEEKAKRAKVSAVAQKGFAPVFGADAPLSDKPIFGFGTSTGAAATSTTSSAFGGQTFGKSSDEPIGVSDSDGDGDGDEETGSGESGSGDNDDEERDPNYDDLPEDEVDGSEESEEDDDLETAMARSRNKGKSLFERVTPNPKLQKESPAESTNGVSTQNKVAEKPSMFSSSVTKGTPEAPCFSPLTPAGSKEPFVPSKTFDFTPTPPTTSSTPTPGASIFAGGSVNGPVAGEGLFGSRPGTPSNADKPTSNIFGGLGASSTASTDQTWKKGSQIKFGSADKDAPAVNITEATPQKEGSKPLFANLFGANTSAANNAPSGSSIGFSFGQSPVPGFLAAASHLGGGSGTASGLSSRATSPGTTDNESVATNEEDYSNDTQVSLMETRPGEENEKVINETRARALRYYTQEQTTGTKLEQGWNTAGLGIVRLLKHKQTGKTRMVMRAEPGANIILNTNLQSQVKYEAAASGNNGSVKFSVFTNEGGQQWLLKVKTLKAAEDLAKQMEENKTAST